jgi:hypothetical protein
MSLDVAILGKNGVPEAEVRIGVNAHVRLIRQGERSHCSLVLRMEDYYRDVDYSADEVPQLATELVRLRESVPEQDELGAVLADLVELARTAAGKKTGLAVIAD